MTNNNNNYDKIKDEIHEATASKPANFQNNIQVSKPSQVTNTSSRAFIRNNTLAATNYATNINIAGKLRIHLENIFYKLKNNKKRVFFICLGIAICCYIYKKYLSPKIQVALDIYHKFAEYKEMIFNDGNKFDEILSQYEPCFNNLIKKLLHETKAKLNAVANLESLYNSLKSSKKEEMLSNWINFKNKVLTYHFTSVFVARFLIIISQSHLLILEKLQINYQKAPKNICDDLLTDLWILVASQADSLITNVEEVISEEINKLQISNSYTWDGYVNALNILQEKLLDLVFDNYHNEIKVKLYIPYIVEVANKIKFLENNNFLNAPKSFKIEVFLKFYQIYYDVLNSNLFHVILIKAINNDFAVIEKDLKNRFELLVKEEVKIMNTLNKKIINSEEIEKNKNENSNVQDKDLNKDQVMQKEKDNENCLASCVQDYSQVNLKMIKIILMMVKVDGLLLDPEASFFLNKNENSENNSKFQEELNEYFKIIYD